MTLRHVQPWGDTLTEFSYRFAKGAHLRQMIAVQPRNPAQGCARVMLRISPEQFLLRHPDPADCGNVAKNDTVQPFFSQPDTWYDVQMKTYGDKVYLWTRPSAQAGEDRYQWNYLETYTEPLLRTDSAPGPAPNSEGYTPIAGLTSDYAYAGFLPLGIDNPGVMHLRDLKITALPCGDAPALSYTNCTKLIISRIQPNWYDTAGEGYYIGSQQHYSPWIELYNTSSMPVNLDGWSVIATHDGVSSPLSSSITVDAGETVRIFCTGNGESDFHTTNGVTMNPSGGFVALSCPQQNGKSGYTYTSLPEGMVLTSIHSPWLNSNRDSAGAIYSTWSKNEWDPDEDQQVEYRWRLTFEKSSSFDMALIPYKGDFQGIDQDLAQEWFTAGEVALEDVSYSSGDCGCYVDFEVLHYSIGPELEPGSYASWIKNDFNYKGRPVKNITSATAFWNIMESMQADILIVGKYSGSTAASNWGSGPNGPENPLGWTEHNIPGLVPRDTLDAPSTDSSNCLPFPREKAWRRMILFIEEDGFHEKVFLHEMGHFAGMFGHRGGSVFGNLWGTNYPWIMNNRTHSGSDTVSEQECAMFKGRWKFPEICEESGYYGSSFPYYQGHYCNDLE